MGQGAGVDDDSLDLVPILLDAIYQQAFDVGLEEFHLDAQTAGHSGYLLVDLLQCLGAVNGGVPPAPAC